VQQAQFASSWAGSIQNENKSKNSRKRFIYTPILKVLEIFGTGEIHKEITADQKCRNRKNNSSFAPIQIKKRLTFGQKT